MRALMGVSLVAMTDYNDTMANNVTNPTYIGTVIDDSGEEFKSDGFSGALLLAPPVSTNIT